MLLQLVSVLSLFFAAAGSAHNYVGCYMDSDDRALPDYKGDGYSVEACAAACTGYDYFGIQRTLECWCGGDEYGKHGESVHCQCDDPINTGFYVNCVYNNAEPTVVPTGSELRNVYFDTMEIVQTHNSLATPILVLSPNQNYDLVKQFQDGIRGFNLDLYSRDDTDELWTFHGPKAWGYNPTVAIQELINELTNPVYPDRFIVVQLEDYMTNETASSFIDLFGDLLITSFDTSQPLSHYVEQNKRVFLATTKSSNMDPSRGMHNSKEYIIENNYKWSSCYFGSPSMGERYPGRTKKPRAAVLINHFCSLTGIGDIIASDAVNSKDRILFNVREMTDSSCTKGQVNIIHVDYYEHGEVFEAQDALRLNDPLDGCWSDGSICGIGTTCWNCCSEQNYWYSKAFTACEEELCWADGTICGIGTTCNSCCNDQSYWRRELFTACGDEPCWTGIRCLAGTSCNRCCNGSEWKWSKFGHFCKD